MNWTPLEDAYNIHHSKYCNISNITYSPVCIYCGFMYSTPLMCNLDGGSFRRCGKCRKEFRANVITNYVTVSTSHLKGTN